MGETHGIGEPVLSIAMAPPRPGSREVLQTLVLGLAAGALFAWVVFPTLAVCLLAALIAAVFALIYLRRGGAIVVEAESLTVPGHFLSRRARPIPLTNIGGVFPAWRGLVRTILVDDGKRLLGIPASRLPENILPQLRGGIEAALAQLPDGQAHIERFRTRQALNEAVASRPAIGTWSLAAGLGALAIALTPAHRDAGTLQLLQAGADFPPLSWHGQWFRLVTATLLQADRPSTLVALSALIGLGAPLERIAGTRALLCVLCVSALAGQAAGSAIQSAFNPAAMIAGTWPGIFGLFAAISAIVARYKASFPNAARVQGPQSAAIGWATITGIASHATGAAAPGMVAGFIVGNIAGRLLCLGRPPIQALRHERPIMSELALACAAIFAIGAGAFLLHAASPASRAGDRMAYLNVLTDHPGKPARTDAAIAQAVANDPASTGSLLHAALRLATHAYQWAGRDDAARQTAEAALDTIYGRLNDDEPPADLESGLFWPPEPFPGYFPKLLRRLAKAPVPAVFGDASGTLPTLTLAGGVITASLPAVSDHGARIYALVRSGSGAIAGMLFIMLPPGFSGSQILPLPPGRAAPSTSPPPALWTDSATRLQLAAYDARPCHCPGDTMGPDFYPMPGFAEAAGSGQ